MKKSFAVCLFVGSLFAVLALSASEVHAGRWRRTKVGWWYDNGNGTWPASEWRWLDGNADGIAECYYFNAEGYLVSDTTTEDGYFVNANGAWVDQGNVQTKKFTVFNESTVFLQDGELDLLAAIIECEAVGEPFDCKVAVGAVVINRMKDKQFPNTITDVIYQKKQFSPVAQGKLAKVLDRGAKEECYEAAREALRGKDITNGCLFFRVNDGREGLVLGNTVFYYKPLVKQ